MRLHEIISPLSSAAFRRWFRKSKVVDHQGNPLVVYHGTRSDFDTFEMVKGNDLGAHFGTLDQAHEFTDNAPPDDTWQQRGGNVMPCYLSIQKPLRLPDLERWQDGNMIPVLRDMGIDVETIERKNITADFFANEMDHAYRKREAVIRALESHGYDGIVYRNTVEGDADSWIAFRSSQIKSAIGNRGSYGKSGNITENVDITIR
jgi:hypothetical protein